MGYQESLVYFRRKNTILNQLKKLKQENKDNLFLNAYTVLEIKQSFRTSCNRRFRKGQIYLHIGGDRSHQTTVRGLGQTLGLEHCKKVVPVEVVADSKQVFQSRFHIIKKI